MTSSPHLARAALAIAIGATCAPTTILRGVPPFAAQQSFGPGRCGPVDSAYASVANATGGQMFMLSPADMAAAGPAIATAMVTGSDAGTALLLSAIGAADTAADSLSFVVDGSVRRLILTAMFDKTGGAAEILGPDGAAVRASDRIQDARLDCGRVLVVDGPAPGVWRASVSPTGRFWLRVAAQSAFDLTIAEFVESGGPLTHGGMFKIAGQPAAGRPAILSLGVSGPAMASHEFALLSEQGRVIKQVTITQASEQTWEGTVDVPLEPFRIAVSGMDTMGARYQRSSRILFQPETVEVRAASLVAVLQAGSESRLTFTVRNAGSDAARYRIDATDDRRLVTRVEPTVLDLEAGAEHQITVWLKVPPGTVMETADVLTVTASSDGQRRTSNSAAMHLGIREQ